MRTMLVVPSSYCEPGFRQHTMNKCIQLYCAYNQGELPGNFKYIVYFQQSKISNFKQLCWKTELQKLPTSVSQYIRAVNASVNSQTSYGFKHRVFSASSTSTIRSASALFQPIAKICLRIKFSTSKSFQAPQQSAQHKHIYICWKQSCNRVVLWSNRLLVAGFLWFLWITQQPNIWM